MKVRPCQSTTTLPKDEQGIYTLAHAVKAGMLPKTAVRQLSTSIYWITTCMESERQTFSLVRKSCVLFCVSNLTLKLKPNEENLTLRRQAQPLNKMSSDYAVLAEPFRWLHLCFPSQQMAKFLWVNRVLAVAKKFPQLYRQHSYYTMHPQFSYMYTFKECSILTTAGRKSSQRQNPATGY